MHDLINNNIYVIKNGKGYFKDYYYKGELIIEGEYLNGERTGNQKEFYHNGKLKYEGRYVNGIIHGKGKEYDLKAIKLIFEGEYYEQKIKGKKYKNGKLDYEVEYIQNKKQNGKGYDKTGNIIYELKNGNGTVEDYDPYEKIFFEGKYLNGRKWKGKEYNNNGQLLFEGQYTIKGERLKGIIKEYDFYDGHLTFEGKYDKNAKLADGKKCLFF